jgi:hypothetical protein
MNDERDPKGTPSTTPKSATAIKLTYSLNLLLPPKYLGNPMTY